MKPIFGYLRADEDTPDAELAQMERALSEFAGINDFVLNGIFSDDTSGHMPEFADLLGELRQSKARHMLLLHLSHLSAHAEIRSQMIHKLERDHDAVVLVVGDKPWTEIAL